MSEKGILDKVFTFKHFEIIQNQTAMKVGTDGVLLGAWVDVNGAKKIIDIGTGTGVIGIMLAQRQQDASVLGIDIDENSFKLAQLNMQNCPWEDRLCAMNQSLQDFCQGSSEKFDLLVSNPPFFTGGVLSESQDKARMRHTIKLSHNDLLRGARSLMHQESRLAIILPYLEGLRIIELAETFGLYLKRVTEVYPKETKGIERVLIELSLKKAENVDRSKIVIQREARNDWTYEYRKLLEDFYLNA